MVPRLQVYILLSTFQTLTFSTLNYACKHSVDALTTTGRTPDRSQIRYKYTSRRYNAPPVGRIQKGWRVTRKNAPVKPPCVTMEMTDQSFMVQLTNKGKKILTMFVVILEYHV